MSMNINGAYTKRFENNRKLFESAFKEDSIIEVRPRKESEFVDADTLGNIFARNAKQFKFTCGVIMSRVDIGNKFCIEWHYNNTNSWESFLDSISKFISASGETITPADINKLKLEYKNLSK